MTFKSQIAEDAAKVFLNTGEFAEEITYTPKGDDPKIIKAIIVRSQIKPDMLDSQRFLHNRIEVFIANSFTDGMVSISTQDTFIAKDTAGNDVIWGITDIISKDDDMWHFSAEK